MSLTCILFLLVYGLLLFKSIRKPSYAVALYLMSFFMTPAIWWWGEPIRSVRWNLLSAVVLLLSVLFSGAFSWRELFQQSKAQSRLVLTMILLAANATFVHLLLAPAPEIGQDQWIIILKTAVLFPLVVLAIRTEEDLKVIVIALIVGASYIGFEATINDRGRIVGNRLEGIGVANARGANDLACLMVSLTALVSPVFLYGRGAFRLVAAATGPLILNVILMCNSRGAFLALGFSGLCYVIFSPAAIRARVLMIAFLGLFAGWLMLGDPRIIERFLTIFNDTDELDYSATSRLDFWRAGMMMIADYPLGAGGDSFRDLLGITYIEKVTGEAEARSVHQGYINEACSWGIQGLILRFALLFGGWLVALRAARAAAEQSKFFIAAVCLSCLAGLAGLFFQSLFGTFLKAEWGLWLVAISLCCDRLVVSGFEPVEDSTPEDS